MSDRAGGGGGGGGVEAATMGGSFGPRAIMASRPETVGGEERPGSKRRRRRRMWVLFTMGFSLASPLEFRCSSWGGGASGCGAATEQGRVRGDRIASANGRGGNI